MRAVRLRGLYAITPDSGDSAGLVARVRRALEAAGPAALAAVQYRNKRAEAQQREREALELCALCRAHRVPFIVNDDVALALKVDADGVHLGRDDGDLRTARARLETRLVGASCYDSLERARAAIAAGADHVAFGSVFASATKPNAVRAPLALFSRARALGVPLIAIGGITLENAPEVIAAGADCLAVISDLFEASDIAARARAYARLFNDNEVTSP
jgi:thiamine-phosphate pyrophosphorylase